LWLALLPTSDKHEQSNPSKYGYNARDKPLCLTTHCATGQDINPLQNPHPTNHKQQNSNDVQGQSHKCLLHILISILSKSAGGGRALHIAAWLLGFYGTL
jgi:hypothetical protein